MTLVDEFCRFVDDKEVWHLAQMVIPEFRSSLVEQDRDYNDQTGELALLNDILSKLSFLPTRRDDENIIVTEGGMVRQHHKRYVEYHVTRGKGRNSMTPEERAESDQRIREVDAAAATASMRYKSPAAEVRRDKGKREKAVSKTEAQDKTFKAGKERERDGKMTVASENR